MILSTKLAVTVQKELDIWSITASCYLGILLSWHLIISCQICYANIIKLVKKNHFSWVL